MAVITTDPSPKPVNDAEIFLSQRSFLPRLMDSESQVRAAACELVVEASRRFPITEVKEAALRPMVVTLCLTADPQIRAGAVRALESLLPDAVPALADFKRKMDQPEMSSDTNTGITLLASRETLAGLVRRYPGSVGLAEIIDHALEIRGTVITEGERGPLKAAQRSGASARDSAKRPRAPSSKRPRASVKHDDAAAEPAASGAEAGVESADLATDDSVAKPGADGSVETAHDPFHTDLTFPRRPAEPEVPVYNDIEHEQRLARLVANGNFEARLGAIAELSRIRTPGAMQAIRALAFYEDMSGMERRQYAMNLKPAEIDQVVSLAQKALRAPIDPSV